MVYVVEIVVGPKVKMGEEELEGDWDDVPDGTGDVEPDPEGVVFSVRESAPCASDEDKDVRELGLDGSDCDGEPEDDADGGVDTGPLEVDELELPVPSSASVLLYSVSKTSSFELPIEICLLTRVGANWTMPPHFCAGSPGQGKLHAESGYWMNSDWGSASKLGLGWKLEQ